MLAIMMLPMMTIMLAVLLIVATYTDLRWSRIPNWLTFPAMGLGIVVQAWVGGLSAVLFGLAGLGVGMGLFVFPYAFKAIGAGDVKLMAAIGSMVGPFDALSIALLSVLAGGVYALGAMTYQWGPAGTSKKIAYSAYGAFVTGGLAWSGDIQLPFKLRYGLAIAVGTLLFLGGIHPFGG